VERYLRNLSTDIIREPIKNRTPDFLMDHNIAVEVRRLNQSFTNSFGKVEGLETGEHKIVDTIEHCCKSYIKGPTDRTYALVLTFERGIGNSQQLKSMFHDAIEKFEYEGEPDIFQTFLSKNVRMKILPCKMRGDYKYGIGSLSDLNSGGMLNSLYTSEIQRCMNEKSIKIQPVFNLYPTWWLVFVDHIFMFEDHVDIEDIIPNLTKPMCFDSVKILSTDHRVLFDL